MMPAPLSIVIPTLNAARHLPETLACLTEGLESGLIRELVICDGGSDDVTLEIAEAIGAKVVTADWGRGQQLRAGADAAQGEWLLFLHADTQLAPGWSGVFRQHIDRAEKAGYCRLRFRTSGLIAWLFETGANMRSRLGLPYGDQGLLISRALYDDIGGYSAMPLMEDVEIARKLKRRLTMLPIDANTDASRYLDHGWLRQGGRNIAHLAGYLVGVSPSKLAKSYQKNDGYSEN